MICVCIIRLLGYEVGIHDSATVNNQQLFKFDNHTYSVPRPYAGKEIGIIAYSFRVEMYYKGNKIWECDRPLFDHENRVYPEHYLYDLDIKPRSRENAFPLLEGILPPELHSFLNLSNSGGSMPSSNGNAFSLDLGLISKS